MTTLPNIPLIPRGNYSGILQPIKEIIEVRNRRRGNPNDRFISFDELVDILTAVDGQTSLSNNDLDQVTIGLDAPVLNSYTSNKTLDTDDFKQIHVMDVSGGDKWFSLPSVDSTNIGEWITLIRSSVAHTLYIIAADSDTILDSTAGGSIECNDATYDLSTLCIRLITSTQWGVGPGCFGIWETR